MTARAAFDPLRALRLFSKHGVRYVMIGGLGARLHGSTAVTNDLDVCYARDRENLDRLAAALHELGATLRDADDDVPFRADARALAAGDHFTVWTRAGALDLLGTPEGVEGYEALARRATVFEIEGLPVPVASLDDLIAMKLAAGRPKDLIEVEVLSALRDEVDERERRDR